MEIDTIGLLKGGRVSEQKVKDWPEKERPRERLIRYGSDSLSDAQLLAIILRTGGGGRSVIHLSLQLLEQFRGLKDIDSAPVSELKGVKGLGMAKIAQLKAAFELGRRLMSESSENNPLFSSSQAVYVYFAPKVKNMKKEAFFCASLDTKNRLIREVKVSDGTLTQSLIHPREAFREAIRDAAHAVVFVHNHPSGDPAPSRDDVSVTEKLKNAGEILGIPVLDHVIIGDGRYLSLREKGLLS